MYPTKNTRIGYSGYSSMPTWLPTPQTTEPVRCIISRKPIDGLSRMLDPWEPDRITLGIIGTSKSGIQYWFSSPVGSVVLRIVYKFGNSRNAGADRLLSSGN